MDEPARCGSEDIISNRVRRSADVCRSRLHLAPLRNHAASAHAATCHPRHMLWYGMEGPDGPQQRAPTRNYQTCVVKGSAPGVRVAPPNCWPTIPRARVPGESPGKPTTPGDFDQRIKHRKIRPTIFWKTPPGILGRPAQRQSAGQECRERIRKLLVGNFWNSLNYWRGTLWFGPSGPSRQWMRHSRKSLDAEILSQTWIHAACLCS